MKFIAGSKNKDKSVKNDLLCRIFDYPLIKV